MAYVNLLTRFGDSVWLARRLVVDDQLSCKVSRIINKSDDLKDLYQVF